MTHIIDPNFYSVLCMLIVLMPLGAAIIAGIFGKTIGKVGAHSLTILAVGLSFLFSAIILNGMIFEGVEPFDFTFYHWGSSGTTSFQVGFFIDRLSALMMVVVSFVSWMVHIYTIGYMKGDPGYQRFFSYISFFTFGMLMLVMSNNFLQLFFGWELVGLMSYLLIGFWFERESANRASLKAFIVNRVGDMGFLIGIAAVLYYFGSLNYKDVFDNVELVAFGSSPLQLSESFEVSGITFICFCLFIGAMGKSAQMPLHVWLPDSMEGPTPISALIHAATMVTAGVFMLARMSPLYEFSDAALNFVLVIGAVTAFFTGVLGVVQNDIKRVIAYSTLSQLGYMMVAMGASAYAIGIFHLMTHAFFKALLFLAAGSVIVALHHEQDIWKMGNLRRYLPITYWTMLIGSLALVAIPGFSGFFSKDLIIEAVEHSNQEAAPFAYVAVLLSVYITALYSFRLFFVVFHGSERMSEKDKKHLHESPAVITVPLILLAIPSVIIGFIFVGPLFAGFFENAITVHPEHEAMEQLTSAFTDAMDMVWHGFISLPFWLAILGIFTAWFCYLKKPEIPGIIRKRFSGIYYILLKKYGFDVLYEWIIAGAARGIGAFFWRFGDVWLIDGVGVNGTADNIGTMSIWGRKFQTGYLYHYAFVMIVGFLILTLWMILY